MDGSELNASANPNMGYLLTELNILVNCAR
jgi:hypothetical protein